MKWVESELEQSKRATSVARIGRKNSFRSYVECCLLWRQTPTAKPHSTPLFCECNLLIYLYMKQHRVLAISLYSAYVCSKAYNLIMFRLASACWG